jgi:methylated-DNA-[protein]-cysteine S-methyltransferase
MEFHLEGEGMITNVESPIGPLSVVVRDEKLVELNFGPREGELGESKIAARLRAYLGGDLAALEAIEVAPEGTLFQQNVWAQLRKIPVGRTISYGELAKRIGNPRAVRAVARANATNPIAIVIPCHRVIGSDGTLTGYAGGLDRKRWLLSHEGAACIAEEHETTLDLFARRL